jgi:predicted nuclease of predicted toxin-antitoxin system
MRFKIDENLPEELASLLRSEGWDAFTVDEQQLAGTPDPPLERICRAENRILVTYDRGFANIKRYQLQGSPGIIVLRLKQQDTEYLLGVAGRLITALREREPRNELWIVRDTRIRIRSA